MCLEINKKLHRCRFAESGYKAIRLKEDMPVYKILLYSAHWNRWTTPFQGLKILFAGGKSVLPPFTDKQFKVVESGHKGEFGYHSFVTEERVGKVLNDMIKHESNYLYRGKAVLCTAVIPKGSMVFYGTHEDICSSNLIIDDPSSNWAGKALGL